MLNRFAPAENQQTFHVQKERGDTLPCHPFFTRFRNDRTSIVTVPYGSLCQLVEPNQPALVIVFRLLASGLRRQHLQRLQEFNYPVLLVGAQSFESRA